MLLFKDLSKEIFETRIQLTVLFDLRKELYIVYNPSEVIEKFKFNKLIV